MVVSEVLKILLKYWALGNKNPFAIQPNITKKFLHNSLSSVVRNQNLNIKMFTYEIKDTKSEYLAKQFKDTK